MTTSTDLPVPPPFPPDVSSSGAVSGEWRHISHHSDENAPLNPTTWWMKSFTSSCLSMSIGGRGLKLHTLT